MMPILVPFLVRRSVRATTVPATRPAPAPAFTARRKLRPGLHAQPLERGGIIVERMAAEEEADGVVFALQPLGRQPVFDRRQHDRRRRGRAAEQLRLADRRILVGALRGGEHGVDGGKSARAVFLDGVEGAGGDEAFQHALVDRARIDAAGEIGKIGERPLAARGENALDRLAADAAQRRQRVVDGVARDIEFDARAIDRGRLDLDGKPLGLGAEFGELVGVAHRRASSTRPGTRPG